MAHLCMIVILKRWFDFRLLKSLRKKTDSPGLSSSECQKYFTASSNNSTLCSLESKYNELYATCTNYIILKYHVDVAIVPFTPFTLLSMGSEKKHIHLFTRSANNVRFPHSSRL